MSRTDLLAAADSVAHTSMTASPAGAVPHRALALLPALRREAGGDLHAWQLLASSPQFCFALMLEGVAALAWGARPGLATAFVWAATVLLGIAAVTRNHIRGCARNPRRASVNQAARELRLLLLCLGFAWGLGAFLILPQPQALAFLFAAGPALTAALIFKDGLSAIAFGAPVALLTASSVFGRFQGTWTAGSILLAGASIAGFSMLHRAILRPRDLC